MKVGGPGQTIPPARHLRRIFESLRRKPGVVGCYLGFKRSEGSRLRRISIVCLVTNKKPAARLEPRARIPREVTWTDRHGEHSIPTDVVRLRRSGSICRSSVGPGDRCNGAGRGSVGVALRHDDYGVVVTTAGHCTLHPSEGVGTYLFDPGRHVALRNTAGGTSGAGTAVKAVCTRVADYALIQVDPATFSCTNRYRTGQPCLPPPSAISIGDRCHVLVARGAPRPATVVGVDAELPIGVGGRMRRLIVTTNAVRGGDSGALLVDGQFRAVGLVVGHIGVDANRVESVYMPVQTVFDRESALFL